MNGDNDFQVKYASFLADLTKEIEKVDPDYTRDVAVVQTANWFDELYPKLLAAANKTEAEPMQDWEVNFYLGMVLNNIERITANPEMALLLGTSLLHARDAILENAKLKEHTRASTNENEN